MASKKYGLGRGLSSIIPQKSSEDNEDKLVDRKSVDNLGFKSREVSQEKEVIQKDEQFNNLEQGVKKVSVGDVLVNEQQPRIYFDEEKIKELSDSIREHGVLQPLVVVKKGNRYELIAGERRLRASKKAGLTKVPVIVREDDLDDQKKLELALIENIQRHDLNLIEEAKAYGKLAEEFGLNQEEIAKKSGKSRSVVANRMRLMKLPVEVRKGLIEGKITEGHAKVILGIENPEKQRALYDVILSQKMTVRDAERKINDFSIGGIKSRTSLRHEKSSQVKSLENQLGSYFNTKVDVAEKGDGGKISIHYFSQDELRDVLSKIRLK